MLIAHVTFSVRVADRHQVIDRLAREADAVRKLAGCLAFVPFADATDPALVGVLHEWESIDAFHRNTASENFASLGRDIRPLMTAPPVSRRFEAALLESVA